MFSHFVNLLLRSWSATTVGYGTTTLGFVLWVVLFTMLLWFAGVLGTWITLRRKRIVTTFKEVLRDSQIELRKHSMVTGDPVFVNTIYLLQAFNIYRHALNGKKCVIMITAPADSKEGNAMGSMVAQFSNSVSGCFTFGPMDANADPDVGKRAETGMVPNKIVFHAARGDAAADQLFMNLGNLIQLKRSYDVPPATARAHLYVIPKQGDENLIWLQFGTNVRWNEQLR